MAATGKALIGEREGWGMLRLVGNIRYTMASELVALIEDLVARAELHTMVIDMRGVNHIDSTGLGLLARIGSVAVVERGRRAVIVRDSEDLDAVLRAVCFDQVFEMVSSPPVEIKDLAEVRGAGSNDWDAQRDGKLILDAHRDLMTISDSNRGAFRDVVEALEREIEPERGGESGQS